ncbi:hypothetical protein ACO0LL_25695 [Undibacterium sp. TC4M20W]|uniref:hypothetical protein n=1 Tax=Undibacterium sp. TC4M20W TaxID=3413052 RepID=UPI003BF3A7BD
MASGWACAGDLDKITGKYNYEQYRLTMANGKTLSMSDIGAKSMSIEVKKDSTISMKMFMIDGKIIASDALIKEIKIDGNKGYWIAQWPEMNYPVKKLFSINGSQIEYDIKFENAQDLSRYGMHEHAVLRKTNAS